MKRPCTNKQTETHLHEQFHFLHVTRIHKNLQLVHSLESIQGHNLKSLNECKFDLSITHSRHTPHFFNPPQQQPAPPCVGQVLSIMVDSLGSHIGFPHALWRVGPGGFGGFGVGPCDGAGSLQLPFSEMHLGPMTIFSVELSHCAFPCASSSEYP